MAENDDEEDAVGRGEDDERDGDEGGKEKGARALHVCVMTVSLRHQAPGTRHTIEGGVQVPRLYDGRSRQFKRTPSTAVDGIKRFEVRTRDRPASSPPVSLSDVICSFCLLL